MARFGVVAGEPLIRSRAWERLREQRLVQELAAHPAIEAFDKPVSRIGLVHIEEPEQLYNKQLYCHYVIHLKDGRAHVRVHA